MTAVEASKSSTALKLSCSVTSCPAWARSEGSVTRSQTVGGGSVYPGASGVPVETPPMVLEV